MTTTPVRAPTARDQAWAALAAELTPAKSLARIDAATARVVTSITVVGTLLTGIGVLAAGLPAVTGPARTLAIAAVVAATLAVLTALIAQILTITRRLNTNNLTEVQHWYRRNFELRAALTQAATILLVLAVAAAGAAATLTITTNQPDQPTIAVTRTTQTPDTTTPAAAGDAGAAAEAATSTITVEVTYRGLNPGQVANTTISTAGQVLAQAAFTPGTDGTAARTLTVDHVPTDAQVTIETSAGSRTCTATLNPDESRPALACNGR
jgi:hypothetical protein